MTIKDLKKVESFIERYQKLPKNADFKLKIMFDNPRQIERDDTEEILNEIDSLFIDIVAFVKVKFGVDSSYIRLSNSIDFDTNINGIPIITTDQTVINRAWIDGLRRMGNMLDNLKAEVKELLENESDTLSIYREKEEYNLKKKAVILFWIFCYIIPITIALFFTRKIINKDSFDWEDIMTWINPIEFGKIEFLLIIVEVTLLAISSYYYQKNKGEFTQNYYERFRVK